MLSILLFCKNVSKTKGGL
ncbi:hypothetical protein E0H78_06010 [Acinetobacter sp. ANC 4641]|nr:hypothetical protein E0H78_06010 [Acinetobacter sp. ANC 4641]